MEKKINIAQLLKDCPKGMELYSPIFGTVYFEGIRDTGRAILIDVTTSCNTSVQFYSDGKFNTYYSESEVTLFPSKSQRDWSKYQRPFKDGDVIFTQTDDYAWVSIFKQISGNSCCTHIDLCINDNDLIFDTRCLCDIGDINTQRLATEEEKQKLFQAIKDNGYKWDPETKTLEKLVKPKFKVGDNIRMKSTSAIYVVTEIREDRYMLDDKDLSLLFKNQDQWELVPNKFDISTLKAFESRVLVRDYDNQIWIPTFWGKYLEDDSNCRYLTTNGCYKYCIPCEGNEHLLGTTDNCNDYYKTWE